MILREFLERLEQYVETNGLSKDSFVRITMIDGEGEPTIEPVHATMVSCHVERSEVIIYAQEAYGVPPVAERVEESRQDPR